MAQPETHLRAVKYEVSVFTDAMRDAPTSAMDARSWAITVADRGHGKWAVILGAHDGDMLEVLGADGEWDFEPRPSSRTDEWLASHRFDLDTALKLAAEQAPLVTLNGLTALDVFAKRAGVGD